MCCFLSTTLETKQESDFQRGIFSGNATDDPLVTFCNLSCQVAPFNTAWDWAWEHMAAQCCEPQSFPCWVGSGWETQGFVHVRQTI